MTAYFLIRGKKGVDLGGWVGEEDLGEVVGRGSHDDSVLDEKKIIFSFKKM